MRSRKKAKTCLISLLILGFLVWLALLGGSFTIYCIVNDKKLTLFQKIVLFLPQTCFGLPLLFWYFYRPKPIRTASKPPICCNVKCKELIPKMVALQKLKLDFQDTFKEFQDVKNQLELMMKTVHCEACIKNQEKCKNCSIGNFSAELRQSVLQCLKTTLVLFPEDIKGRRRARLAAEIFLSEVLKEQSFFGKIKSFIGKAMKRFLPENHERKKICALIGLIGLNVVWPFSTYFADIFSDFKILGIVAHTYYKIGNVTGTQLSNCSQKNDTNKLEKIDNDQLEKCKM